MLSVIVLEIDEVADLALEGLGLNTALCPLQLVHPFHNGVETIDYQRDIKTSETIVWVVQIT